MKLQEFLSWSFSPIGTVEVANIATKVDDDPELAEIASKYLETSEQFNKKLEEVGYELGYAVH